MSQHGLWLLIDGQERYLPYERFPWFQHATIAQLATIERPRPEYLHWPELDVDLTLESIERPEDFPLVSRVAGEEPQGTR